MLAAEQTFEAISAEPTIASWLLRYYNVTLLILQRYLRMTSDPPGYFIRALLLALHGGLASDPPTSNMADEPRIKDMAAAIAGKDTERGRGVLTVEAVAKYVERVVSFAQHRRDGLEAEGALCQVGGEQ